MRALYIFPVPMFGIKIQFAPRLTWQDLMEHNLKREEASRRRSGDYFLSHEFILRLEAGILSQEEREAYAVWLGGGGNVTE